MLETTYNSDPLQENHPFDKKRRKKKKEEALFVE